jgi:PAS domain S-box-containing protein
LNARSRLKVAALEIDGEGVVVTWTRSAERMLGFTPREAVGRNLWSLCGAIDASQGAELLRSVLEEGEHAEDGTFNRKSGELLRASLLLCVLPSSGAPERLAAVFVELDDHLQLEEAFAAEHATRVHLEDRDRERELFVATLAHDLRQPLSVINASAHLVQLRGQPVGELAGRIQRATAHLSDLVSEMGDVSTVRIGGEMALDRTRVDLGLLAREVARDLDNGRILLIELDEELAGDWDRPRLRRIVYNLVANALSHSPKDTHITISTRRSDGEALLCVENRCSPLLPGELAQLFEPFHRRSTSGGHAGLGLHIARELARAHGGDVIASWNSGTVEFAVVLPMDARARFSRQRRHPRTPFDNELKIGAGDESFWAVGHDLSPRGLAFFCESELHINQRIKVVAYCNQGSFSVLGTVRHAHQVGARSLVGVEFPLDLSTAEVELLRRGRPN